MEDAAYVERMPKRNTRPPGKLRGTATSSAKSRAITSPQAVESGKGQEVYVSTATNGRSKRRRDATTESSSDTDGRVISPGSASDDEDWRIKLEEKGVFIDRLHEELQAAKRRVRAKIENLKEELRRIRRFEC